MSAASLKTRTGKPIEPDPVSTGGGSVGRKSAVLGLLCITQGVAQPVPASAALPDSGGQLDEIIVTATLRAVPESELPGSVSVLNATALRDAGQQNFEDVIALVPNLNWAG